MICVYLVRVCEWTMKRRGASPGRRGGGGHPDQGKEYRVPPSRPYWLAWVRTATRLLETSEWHPNVNGVGEWRRHLQAFATNGEDVNAVVFELPKLLNPKLGRPQRLELLHNAHLTSNKTHIVARNARYRDMILMLRDVSTRIRPLHERMQDARKMKGYSKEEVAALLGCLNNMQHAVESMERMLETSIAKPEERGRPPATTSERSERAAAQAQANPVKIYFDDDFPDAQGSPLSPAEQLIAQQAPNPPHNQPRKLTFGEELEFFEPDVPKGYAEPKGFGIKEEP